MKLCRFDLSESPGKARTGMMFDGRVYETDGSEPVAVHEWTEARLLAPIGFAPSVRLFENSGANWEEAERGTEFSYLNPWTIHGPNEHLRKPGFATRFGFEPCLGVIIAGAGQEVKSEDADELVLGLALINSLSYDGLRTGRGRDAGFVIGPAITTPEELDDSVTIDDRGRRYRFRIGARVNGQEIFSMDLSSLGYTAAELIAFASESAPVRQGDVFAISLGFAEGTIGVGDEVQLFSDKLGVLTNRIVA